LLPAKSFEVFSDVVSLRCVWQEADLRHETQPLAPAHQAALEPEHPAGARDRERIAEAGERVYVLPEGREGREALMQGTIKMFDPATNEGIVVRDTDREDFVLAANALEGSIFRMLRQGQRIVFEADHDGRATKVRIGAEADMGLPTAQI
jgi:CspA family cold shock protein